MPSYDTHVYDTTKLTRVRRRVSSWRSLSDSVSWSTDRKSTRLNSSHLGISYAVFCLKKNIGEPAKVLKGLHQTADHCRGITALDDGDKAHARIAQHRRAAVELAERSRLLLLKLVTVE